MVLGAAVASPGAHAQSALAAAPEAGPALHLLQRATYGARAQDLAAVLELGRDAWLDRQLHPERIADDAVAARLAAYPTVGLSMGALMRDYAPRPQPAPAMMDSATGRPRRPDPAQLTPEQRRELQMRNPARLMGDLVGAKLTRAVYSERQLEEVMTDFWFNHFNVFFGKGIDRYLIADYEREAIRPHVFGRFEDMLRATARHPAMLFYLDNWTSAVPDSMNPDAFRRRAQADQLVRRIRTMSREQKDQLVRNGRITREQLERLERGEPIVPAPQQRGRERGINENYARELMELHTLGVDGGYTQRDVVEVARAFTGWTFVRPNQNPQQRPAPPRPLLGRPPLGRPLPREVDEVEFVFRQEMHDPGEKVVLGTRLRGGRGMEDGEEVLRMLARHPSTARFIASKLVERFVTDEPAPELVEDLAQVFLRSDGDLRAVTRELFSSPRFYDERWIGAKVKTPYELVASALRVTHADVGPSRRIVETLRTMGNLPYNEPAPTGYPATSEEWVNSGAMLARMNFGLALAAGGMEGVRIDAPRLIGESAPRALGPERLPDLLAALLPGADTRRLEAGIRADLEGRTQDPPRARAARALGLIIGSPDFQKR
jgi:uncharacterized protein (DUF1800 family)